jgi:ABC-type nitrate/sulfonate/bicarbonate transport system ATPase subunit
LTLTRDLERILRETAMTAVMATHGQLEALHLADRIDLGVPWKHSPERTAG